MRNPVGGDMVEADERGIRHVTVVHGVVRPDTRPGVVGGGRRRGSPRMRGTSRGAHLLAGRHGGLGRRRATTGLTREARGGHGVGPAAVGRTITPSDVEVLGVRHVEGVHVLGHLRDDALLRRHQCCGHPNLAVATIHRAAPPPTAEVLGFGQLVREVEQRRHSLRRMVIGHRLADAVHSEGVEPVFRPRGVTPQHVAVTEHFLYRRGGRQRPLAAEEGPLQRLRRKEVLYLARQEPREPRHAAVRDLYDRPTRGGRKVVTSAKDRRTA